MLPLLLVTLLLHPVHETVAEVQWNRDTRRLEVAMRIDALDEHWLRKRHRSNRVGPSKTPAGPTASVRRVEAATPAEAEGQWELGYLRSRFRIAESPKENESDRTSYRWIGRDDDRGHVWWYFEIEPADGMPPRWIEQRVLFEKEEDHANRVVILGQVPKRTMILTMQKPRASFHQGENDESESDAKAGR